MLESTNDYMSVFVMVMIILSFLAVIYHIISLRVTATHLRQEADYYALNKNRRK